MFRYDPPREEELFAQLLQRNAAVLSEEAHRAEADEELAITSFVELLHQTIAGTATDDDASPRLRFCQHAMQPLLDGPAPSNQHEALMVLHNVTKLLNTVADHADTLSAAARAKAHLQMVGDAEATAVERTQTLSAIGATPKSALKGVALRGAVEAARADAGHWLSEHSELTQRLHEAETELARLRDVAEGTATAAGGSSTVDDLARASRYQALRRERLHVEQLCETARRLLLLPTTPPLQL